MKSSSILGPSAELSSQIVTFARTTYFMYIPLQHGESVTLIPFPDKPEDIDALFDPTNNTTINTHRSGDYILDSSRNELEYMSAEVYPLIGFLKIFHHTASHPLINPLIQALTSNPEPVAIVP